MSQDQTYCLQLQILRIFAESSWPYINARMKKSEPEKFYKYERQIHHFNSIIKYLIFVKTIIIASLSLIYVTYKKLIANHIRLLSACKTVDFTLVWNAIFFPIFHSIAQFLFVYVMKKKIYNYEYNIQPLITTNCISAPEHWFNSILFIEKVLWVMVTFIFSREIR